MTFDLDPPAARACATAVADTGAQVVAGATGAPAADTVPRWATSDALTALVDAARRELGTVGSDIRSAGQDVRAAVDDYLDADDRAARRLRAALWN
jgi:hypothetical protein